VKVGDLVRKRSYWLLLGVVVKLDQGGILPIKVYWGDYGTFWCQPHQLTGINEQS